MPTLILRITGEHSVYDVVFSQGGDPAIEVVSGVPVVPPPGAFSSPEFKELPKMITDAPRLIRPTVLGMLNKQSRSQMVGKPIAASEDIILDCEFRIEDRSV